MSDIEAMEDDEVHAARIEDIREAVEQADRARIARILEPLHAADIADILEQINPGERRDLLTLWSGEIDGDVL